jgi:DNA-directed RNA polymerase beta' subunit
MFSASDTEFYLDDDGTYISGILCKKTVGPVSNGLIHKIWLYDGHEAANRFISNTQFLMNNWLHGYGFSMGIRDCVNSPFVESQMREFIEESLDKVDKLDKVGNSSEANVNRMLNSTRDRSGKCITDQMTSKNNLFNMTSSGSKGSVINIAQVMACVGQQNVNGCRIGNGYAHRTLPHFPRHETGYASKGFVKHSYMNGLDPTEFFFHAMGGREGVIDTAIKTSETGYIQRRLVKAMEDVVVGYDRTVRNSIGDILQFSYGEDGFDGSWLISQTLNGRRMHLPFDIELTIRNVERSRTIVDSPTASTEYIERMLRVFESNALIHDVLKSVLGTRGWSEHQVSTFMSVVNERTRNAIVAPGEMVGTIAAQSLGQPITQMTLNTFHAAGISSQNLTMGVPRLKELINLSKNLKSPSMAISVSRPVAKSYFVGLYLTNISDNVSFHETMDFEPSEIEYMNIVGVCDFECARCAEIHIDKEKLTMHGLSMVHITCAIFKYSEIVWCSSFRNVIYVRCLDEASFVSNEEFMTYIVKLKNEVHIKGVKDITAMFADDHDDTLYHTSGSNLSSVLVDPNVIPTKTFTNDVMEMYTHFGVEAARMALCVEIKRVIEYDGSYLNYRHLSVLLDVMTYRGRVMAITRHGINRTETGVLMRCSFEETVNIILDAAVHAELDPLKGVTENIIMGKMARVGTGCVDVLMNHCFDDTADTSHPYSPPSPSRDHANFIKSYHPLKEGFL